MSDSESNLISGEDELGGPTDGLRCAGFKGIRYLACVACLACVCATSGSRWWHNEKAPGEDIVTLEELREPKPQKGNGDLSFPLQFEGHFGVCPPGFTCYGQAKVCVHPAMSQPCFHPGIENLQGKQYFDVGHDFITAHAISQVFYMPSTIQEIRLLYSGGAYLKSGFFLHALSGGKIICHIANDKHTNAFTQESCEGLQQYKGEPVFICIVDAQRTHWGKVLIDNVRLLDQFGEDLQQGGLVKLSPTAKPDCNALHEDSFLDSHSPHMRSNWPEP